MIIKDWKASTLEAVKRVDAVDLFKFIVLFFMIQGHLFRAYLLPAVREAAWWQVHEISHGVVAPGFLFSAGFAAFLSYFKKKEQYNFRNRAFFRRIRRIIFIFAIGYWIHLPYLSFLKIARELPLLTGRIQEFLKIDILQCIGAGLLLFTILAALVKNEKWLLAVTAVLTLAFFLLPGTVKDIPLPYVLKAYFSHEISNFPVFPWAGYLFAGILAAYAFTQIKTRYFFRLLLISGLVTFPLYFFIRPAVYRKAELTLSGNLTKIGGVFLLLCLAQLIVSRCRGKWVELLKRAGRESLFVYVIQNFIIFSSIFGGGFKPRFQESLTVWPAFALFYFVQMFVFSHSLLYGYVKDQCPRLWRAGFILFWSVFFLVLLVRSH